MDRIKLTRKRPSRHVTQGRVGSAGQDQQRRLYAHVVSVDDVPRERSSERPILSQTDLSAAYKSRPLGRLGVEAVNFLRNSWLRSLLASLLFRSRWKRALSPLSADMVTQA